jgi:uncharacterized membrane protein YheB (UPF0754 family)
MKAPTEILGSRVIKGSRSYDFFRWPISHLACAMVLAVLAAILAEFANQRVAESVCLVAAGALAGYLTNKVAIGLLFRPTQPRFGGKLYGLFYKRRDEFGEKLIELTCGKFMTPDFFSKLFQSKGIRDALLRAMGKTWDEWSKEDGQSIRRLLDSSLGDGFVGKWTDEITMRVGNSVCESLVDCVDDKSWNEIREDILTAVGHKSLSELSQTEDLPDVLSALITRKFRTHDIWQNLRSKVKGTLREWAEQGKTIGDIFPQSIQARIEEAMLVKLRNHLMQGVGNYLAKDENREWIGEMARKECERIVWGKVSSMNPIKQFFVRTFGGNDLNDGISQIPEMIAESLSGLSGWLLGSPEDDRITSALKERIPEVWKFKIEGILKVLDSQGFDNLWDSLSSVVFSDKSDLFEKGLARAFEPFLGKPIENLMRIIEKNEDDPSLSLGDVLRRSLRDEDFSEFISLTFRKRTRSLIVRFLDCPVGELWRNGGWKKNLDTLRLDAFPALADQLLGKAGDFSGNLPVREELRKVWAGFSNEDLRDCVEGALSDEFATLVNLGISLGAATGFLFSLTKLFLP